MHEDCGEFVDEQHGGMVCYGQQQKENNCRSTRHSQGYPRSEKISKPASKTQKPQVFCLLIFCDTSRQIFVLTFQTWDPRTAGSNRPWFVNNQTTRCRSQVSLPNTRERHNGNTYLISHSYI